MAYIPQQDSIISTDNSTSVPLSASATFTGTGEDVSNFSTIALAIKSDVEATVKFQFSTDNVNWDITEDHEIEAAVSFDHVFTVVAKYFRVVYINSATAQTYFRLQSIMHKEKAEPASIHGHVSVGNSSKIPLSASATFTGTGEDVTRFASSTHIVYADVAGTFKVEFSSDNVNWDVSNATTIRAGKGSTITEVVSARYFRVVFANGTTTQTNFRLQTVFHKTKSVVAAPIDFDVEVASGNIDNYENITLIMNSRNIGTTYSDLWDVGGLMTRPTTGETYEVVSANANDTSAGTGARTLLLITLDANDNEQTTVVTLNGGTASISGTHTYPRYAQVITAGSNETNVGDITIQVAGGGAARLKIIADEGATNNSHFKVPAGKTVFPISFTYFVQKGQDALVRPRILTIDANPAYSSSASIPLYQNAIESRSFANIAIPELTEFKFQAKSTNPNVSVTVILQMRVKTHVD
jgi:hypothetical protein